jgi:hypothetical protein
VLETLYKPFLVNKLVLTAADVEKMQGQVEELTTAAFIAEKFSANDLKSGKNLITFNIALDYINSFLKNEIRFLNTEKPQLLIKQLEKEFRYQLDFNQTSVLLKGKADRIDSFGNKVRILDYKTGSVEPRDLSIKVMEDVLDKQKAFQVLFYAYLFSKENDVSNTSLNSGIVALKKKNDIYLPFTLAKEDSITTENLVDFEKILLQLLDGMMDASIPFEHNKKAKYCLYCN